MGKGGSIIQMVFSNIDTVVSTVENIHADIVGKPGDKNGNEIHNAGKRKNVYDAVKSINGSIGNIVSGFFH